MRKKGDQVAAEPAQHPCAWGWAGAKREVAQLGRAPALGAGGRRFKSGLPDFGGMA